MGKGEDEEWKWHYSALTGIMYGPIPVGIIVVGLGVVAYFVFFKH